MSTIPTRIPSQVQHRMDGGPERGQMRPPFSSAASASPGDKYDGSPDTAQQHQLSRVESHESSGDANTANPQTAADEEAAKKARACEACRNLKVKCEPDLNEETASCKRCSKAGRKCVVTVPTRKRQKKTDNRVADLEKKIDALTATLQARGSTAGIVSRKTGEEDGEVEKWPLPSAKTWHSGNTQQGQRAGSTSGRNLSFAETLGYEDGATGEKRKASDSTGMGQPEAQRPKTEVYTTADHQNFLAVPRTNLRSANPEFIERGFITAQYAEELLDRYKNDMATHMPAILVPPEISAMELNRSRPVLFSAIMAAATGENPALQKVLQKDLMSCFAEKVFLAGEKTLDTVQAILVAVIWYFPPENFEELKFYQLIHTAAVMAIDIGLGRKVGGRKAAPFGASLSDPRGRPPPPDPKSLECRRTWLTCYILATNAAMALHRPNLIRWSSYIAESVEMLESSPEALPSDQYLAHMVYIHKLSEEVADQFSMDHHDEGVSITDSRTQYSLRALEREWEKRKAAVSVDMQRPTLMMTFHTINLYMHELVLNSRAAAEQQRPPFNPDSLSASLLPTDDLSSAHISALTTCLQAITQICDTFLSMTVPVTRCIPVYFFVRIAYALVILIKMYFSASKQGSEFGRVVEKENLKVGWYLDKLVERFMELAHEEKCRPASKFLVVLAMLRGWFNMQSREQNGEGPGDGPGPLEASLLSVRQGLEGQGKSQTAAAAAAVVQRTPMLQTQELPSQTSPMANTPLHLLSEVATGHSTSSSHQHPQAQPDSSSASGSASNSNSTPFMAPILPQQFFPDTSLSGTGGGDAATASTPATSMPPQWQQSGPSGFTPGLSLDGGLGPDGTQMPYQQWFGHFDIGQMADDQWFTDVMSQMPNATGMFFM